MQNRIKNYDDEWDDFFKVTPATELENRIEAWLPEPPALFAVLVVGPEDKSSLGLIPTHVFYMDAGEDEEIDQCFMDNPDWVGRQGLELYIPATEHGTIVTNNKINLN
jgi:hypothetical protein